MKKIDINEVIIVEGLHDREKVLQCVNAEVLISNGTHFSADFLRVCADINRIRGIIVFTDPDGPGEWIRKRIMAAAGSCKHASLPVLQSRKSGQVGVEHATCDDIQSALLECTMMTENQVTLSHEDMFSLGLNGQSDSQARRDHLAQYFRFPRSNAKRCRQYLNMMMKNKTDCVIALAGYCS